MAQGIDISHSMNESSKKLGRTWLIVSLIIIALLLAGAGIGYWQLTKSFNKQKADLQKQIDDLNKKLKATETSATTATTTTPVATTPAAFDYAGWQTYINDVYHYQFKYPSGITITEAQKEEFSMSPEESAAGKTFDQIYAELTGKVCLYIKSGEASIYISAPINKDFSHVICGRTGVGADQTITPKEEDIIIDSKTYTASGDTTNLIVSLADETRIEYSGNLDGEDGTVVRHIIESYQAI